jgi:Rad3-related DNA helicase
MYQQMNPEQKRFVDAVNSRLEADDGEHSCFFLEGPGGTGKTFVYKALTHLFKSHNMKIKNCASTGIAATLLPNGRTAHKTFGLAVPLKWNTVCKLKKGQQQSNAATDGFQWDEAPMSPKYGFENADSELRLRADPTNPRKDLPFGKRKFFYMVVF